MLAEKIKIRDASTFLLLSETELERGTHVVRYESLKVLMPITRLWRLIVSKTRTINSFVQVIRSIVVKSM